MPHETDVVTAIRDQHRTIRRLFDEIDQAAPDDRPALFEALAGILAVHEAAEQAVVYPAIQGDDQSAANVIAERTFEVGAAREAIADLHGKDFASDDCRMAYDAFRTAVRAHFAREEALILPRLARQHAHRLQSLGQSFLAESVVTTTQPDTATQHASHDRRT